MDRPCSTAWNSTTSCAMSTVSTTRRSSRWTWNFSAVRTSPTSSSTSTADWRNDTAPKSLRDFCVAYRAVVRAKVDCIRVAQGHPAAGARRSPTCDIALKHLRACTIRLIVIGGGPGTGKTTMARGLAQQIGAQVISTDEVRRELQSSGVITGPAGELDAGLYSPQNVSIVYDEVLRRARALLCTGSPVILDGTWRDAKQRSRARGLADQTFSPIVEFVCTLPLGEAMERIATRGPSASDATPQIATSLGEQDLITRLVCDRHRTATYRIRCGGAADMLPHDITGRKS